MTETRPTTAPEAAEAKRRTRYRRWVALGGLVALLLAGLTVVIMSRTRVGQERLRRVTVNWLEDRFAGRIAIGEVGSEASLLGTMTLGDVTITEPGGRPFVAVRSAILSYDWRTLVSGRVVLDRVQLEGVDVVVERLPDWDEWNFDRAFRAGPDDPADTARVLVELHNVSITDASVELRLPWDGEAEDSARLLLEDTPSGPLRVFALQDLSLNASRILAETPDEPGRLVELDGFSAHAYVWDQPARIESARGTIAVRDSVVTLDLDRIELPGSSLSALGQVVFGDSGPRVDVRLEAPRVALTDLTWLHPELPTVGRGRGTILIRALAPGRVLWFAEDLDLETPDTRVRGTVGLVTGDTLYFSRLDLVAGPLDVPTLERLLPVDLPLDGLEVEALRLNDGG
ncbi:MAG: hypothetical protein ABFS34_10230 [Gemmatimonadota bacterium]